MKKNEVTMCMGKDEWWCNWFKCPNCNSVSVASSFTFCPDCGVKLIWPKEFKDMS